ncbi:hypothetical protein [Candidatus Enterococcus moelleringii]|uniref:hypothetical protein n=1 Tax=Candidatus Enterococcus moelleringii TaxID=2815325 RepID=UPI00325A9C4B
MFIINLISVGLVLVVLIIVFYRFAVNSRLKKISQQKGQPLSFQKKLAYVKYLEQEKHVSFILFLSLLFAAGMLLSTYSLFEVEDQMHNLSQKNSQLKDELYKMRQEQRRFINDIPIKAYPEEGLGLGDYAWQEIFEHENRKVQYEIENDLSTKAEPYFGLSSTLIVLDIPSKTLSIAMVGNSGTEDKLETLEANQLAFVQEAKVVTNLTQVTFQMHVTDENNEEKTYNRTFTRSNNEEDFTQVEVEE